MFSFPDALEMIVQQTGPFSGSVECGLLKPGRVSPLRLAKDRGGLQEKSFL